MVQMDNLQYHGPSWNTRAKLSWVNIWDYHVENCYSNFKHIHYGALKMDAGHFSSRIFTLVAFEYPAAGTQGMVRVYQGKESP